ncbi:hypothetical protein G7Y89_g13249 [Cudoniella acicularis]|uniref:Uncharacterized protein n=1 Tax=Cudoniella acicularis TaxID=354080 RepID=A0A8H4R7M8_9HELO|nr:hypothetical protein G7Y89_g13249 [Cudoniella acicularis]
MYSRSKGKESRRDYDSGGWSDEAWDESRGLYYRSRRKADGDFEYYYLQPGYDHIQPEYDQAEDSSIPRTSTSANDYSYSASEERRGRSREPDDPDGFRQRGHTVSPGPQGTPPPDPPPPEETSSPDALAQSISGLSNLSMSPPPDQPYSSYTTQPSQLPEALATYSNSYNTTNMVADQRETGPGMFEMGVSSSVETNFCGGYADQRQELRVELEMTNSCKPVTAVTATSDVSLISEKLAGILQLKEKPLEQKPQLEGEEKTLKIKKLAHVYIRCGDKKIKERVYIFSKSQSLKEPLLLKRSTMDYLAPAPPSSSSKDYSVQTQHQAPLSPTSITHSGYPNQNYAPGSSIPSYPSPPPSESSYTPGLVASDAYSSYASPQAFTSFESHQSLRRSSGKDETRRRKR